MRANFACTAKSARQRVRHMCPSLKNSVSNAEYAWLPMNAIWARRTRAHRPWVCTLSSPVGSPPRVRHKSREGDMARRGENGKTKGFRRAFRGSLGLLPQKGRSEGVVRPSAEASVEGLASFRKRCAQPWWVTLPQNLPWKSWRLLLKGSSNRADGPSAEGGAGSSWVTQKTLAGW